MSDSLNYGRPADPLENNSEVHKDPLRLFSVVIPAHNEEGCIASTVEHLHLELRLQNVPHEIVMAAPMLRGTSF